MITAYLNERGPVLKSESNLFMARSLAAELGHLAADNLDDRAVATYGQGRGLSRGSVRRELGLLRAALHLAQRRRLIDRVPAFTLPASPPHRDRWLTRNEVAALLWAARGQPAAGQLQRLILIALYTGARRQAVLDLTWRRIDLNSQTLSLNPAGRSQTAKRRPALPIAPRLAQHLARWRAHATDLDARVVGPPGFHGNLRRGWEATVEKSRLQNATLHTLRHTAGAWMAQAGVDLRIIAAFLGHSLTRTTEIYAHLHPTALRQALKAFK